MSNNFWSYSPELKTTGVVKKFTQKLEYKKVERENLIFIEFTSQ